MSPDDAALVLKAGHSVSERATFALAVDAQCLARWINRGRRAPEIVEEFVTMAFADHLEGRLIEREARSL